MPSIWMAIYSCSQALYWISFSLSLSHCHCVFVTVTELFRHSYLSNFRRTCSCCSESPPSSSCKLKIVSSKKHLLEHMTDPEHFQTNNWWKKNFHSHSVFFFVSSFYFINWPMLSIERLFANVTISTRKKLRKILAKIQYVTWIRLKPPRM